jgi:imidazole glycerol-phosphate synthase subunit HisH
MTGIINYGAGNIFSLTAALNRLHIPYGMINEPEELGDYERYIIPGVGHAGAAMEKLRRSGLAEIIPSIRKPVLGICVGMQLLTSFSEEGNSELMGIVPLQTLHFDESLHIKIPQIGWNKVRMDTGNPLLKNLGIEQYFYFVHSFFIEFNPKFTIASAEYGIKFSAVIQKDNFYGVQFHPEKSGSAGEQILTNFSLIA